MMATKHLSAVNLICLSFYCVLGMSTPSLAQTATQPQPNRPTLQSGSKGSVVSELQAALKLLGYYQGEVDGNYSSALAAAVSQFQQAAGLEVNGIADTATWQRLFPLTPPGVSVATPSPEPTTTSQPPATETPNTEEQSAANNNDTSPPTSSTTNNQTTDNSDTSASSTTNNQTTDNSDTSASSTTNSNNQASNLSPSAIANLPTLREGSEGDDVRKLQERLKVLGVFNGQIDGIFGSETLEAVIAAQNKLGLTADGVVGSQTWQALFK